MMGDYGFWRPSLHLQHGGNATGFWGYDRQAVGPALLIAIVDGVEHVVSDLVLGSGCIHSGFLFIDVLTVDGVCHSITKVAKSEQLTLSAGSDEWWLFIAAAPLAAAI